MWNELTFLWNELTIWWNDLTIDWNDLTWNDLTMERNDRKSWRRGLMKQLFALDFLSQTESLQLTITAGNFTYQYL